MAAIPEHGATTAAVPSPVAAPQASAASREGLGLDELMRMMGAIQLGPIVETSTDVKAGRPPEALPGADLIEPVFVSQLAPGNVAVAPKTIREMRAALALRFGASEFAAIAGDPFFHWCPSLASAPEAPTLAAGMADGGSAAGLADGALAADGANGDDAVRAVCKLVIEPAGMSQSRVDLGNNAEAAAQASEDLTATADPTAATTQTAEAASAAEADVRGEGVKGVRALYEYVARYHWLDHATHAECTIMPPAVPFFADWPTDEEEQPSGAAELASPQRDVTPEGGAGEREGFASPQTSEGAAGTEARREGLGLGSGLVTVGLSPQGFAALLVRERPTDETLRLYGANLNAYQHGDATVNWVRTPLEFPARPRNKRCANIDYSCVTYFDDVTSLLYVVDLAKLFSDDEEVRIKAACTVQFAPEDHVMYAVASPFHAIVIDGDGAVCFVPLDAPELRSSFDFFAQPAIAPLGGGQEAAAAAAVPVNPLTNEPMESDARETAVYYARSAFFNELDPLSFVISTTVGHLLDGRLPLEERTTKRIDPLDGNMMELRPFVLELEQRGGGGQRDPDMPEFEVATHLCMRSVKGMTTTVAQCGPHYLAAGLLDDGQFGVEDDAGLPWNCVAVLGRTVVALTCRGHLVVRPNYGMHASQCYLLDNGTRLGTFPDVYRALCLRLRYVFCMLSCGDIAAFSAGAEPAVFPCPETAEAASAAGAGVRASGQGETAAPTVASPAAAVAAMEVDSNQ